MLMTLRSQNEDTIAKPRFVYSLPRSFGKFKYIRVYEFDKHIVSSLILLNMVKHNNLYIAISKCVFIYSLISNRLLPTYKRVYVGSLLEIKSSKYSCKHLLS